MQHVGSRLVTIKAHIIHRIYAQIYKRNMTQNISNIKQEKSQL